MGYLCLTRHEGELIRITIDPGVDTEKLLRHLLRDGITIGVAHVQAHQVRLAIEAPLQMRILRDELTADMTTGSVAQE